MLMICEQKLTCLPGHLRRAARCEPAICENGAAPNGGWGILVDDPWAGG